MSTGEEETSFRRRVAASTVGWDHSKDIVTIFMPVAFFI
jgi:hypothetical protein